MFALVSWGVMALVQQEAVQEFIDHHVMHHAGSPSAWNLPFVHVGPLEWFHYDSVMLFFVVALLVAVAFAVRRAYRRTEVPMGAAAVAETYVLFVRDQIVYPNLGEAVGRRFLSFFCTLFIFILAANLLGLIPIFSTATGNISVTAGLATIFMFTAIGAVIKLRGLSGFKAAFVVHGLPVWLSPFITLMEVLGFFTRVFALTIRLFCNLMAGHILIYSLLGMVLVFGVAAAPAVAMAVLMYFFELFVAFLQAYIFTLLSAIFLNMLVNPAH
jgi:F-type H+-transporting ATPase subunit a